MSRAAASNTTGMARKNSEMEIPKELITPVPYADRLAVAAMMAGMVVAVARCSRGESNARAVGLRSRIVLLSGAASHVSRIAVKARTQSARFPATPIGLRRVKQKPVTKAT